WNCLKLGHPSSQIDVQTFEPRLRGTAGNGENMGWLFGRKSAVSDARALVPAWSSTSEQPGFARRYEAQFDEVFRRNPVGQRAVRLVAGMLGSLTVDGDGRAVELVQADGLLEGIAAQLMLHGNSYARLIVDEDGAPAEICTLRPERV